MLLANNGVNVVIFSYGSSDAFSFTTLHSLGNGGPQTIGNNDRFWSPTKKASGGNAFVVSRRSTSLFGGYGIATNYTWKEEQYEIEVTVSVPDGTRGKDILFTPKPRSIDLRLKGGGDDGNDVILLDGSREMKGRIDMDGTFWSITDKEGSSVGRDVTLTIEKMIVPPSKDSMEIIDFDWGGIYLNEDDDEILEKQYDEPEELDVREYAASLGVDIDNINMTMVDKSMFSGGLNMTRNAMDELTKGGYVQEVTQQSDGTEYIVGPDGEAVPFTPYGNMEDDDILQQAGVQGIPFPKKPAKSPIPFIDMPAPWQNTMPVEEVRGKDNEPILTNDDDDNTLKNEKEEENSETKNANDPIDLLTVARLKEIKKKEKLKVSGSKKQLQERLRSHGMVSS